MKKSRVSQVTLCWWTYGAQQFWEPVPFDKKDRVIPSSVECLFNTDYYTSAEASKMTTETL